MFGALLAEIMARFCLGTRKTDFLAPAQTCWDLAWLPWCAPKGWAGPCAAWWFHRDAHGVVPRLLCCIPALLVVTWGMEL